MSWPDIGRAPAATPLGEGGRGMSRIETRGPLIG